VHLVPDVLVQVLSDPSRGMTELLRHDLDIDARLEGERRRGVPRRVELDDRQPGRLRQLTEAPGDVVRVQRLAGFVGEYAARICPGLPESRFTPCEFSKSEALVGLNRGMAVVNEGIWGRGLGE
jgi:hypothetical protein